VRVFFDATAFCADFRMAGNAWRVFRSGGRRAGLVGCIAASVRDEVVNRYGEELLRVAQRAEKLERDYRRISGCPVVHGFPRPTAVESTRDVYSAELMLLADEFAHAPYPTVSHQDVVARALTRRRPFRESGKGYRDSLLWYTILECLQTDRMPVALVSANSADFGELELHTDLSHDLDALGLDRGHVRLFGTLEKLNHALILPVLERLDSLRSQLSGGGAICLPKWVQEHLWSLLCDEEMVGPLAPGHGATRFSPVCDVRSVQIDALRQLAGGQVLLAATADVAGTLDVTVTWADYERHEDVREFIGSDDNDPFSVASADVPTKIKVAFSLILSAEGASVLSWELDWFETDYGARSDINPHPADDEGELPATPVQWASHARDEGGNDLR
jgi:hypothetical protein